MGERVGGGTGVAPAGSEVRHGLEVPTRFGLDFVSIVISIDNFTPTHLKENPSDPKLELNV